MQLGAGMGGPGLEPDLEQKRDPGRTRVPGLVRVWDRVLGLVRVLGSGLWVLGLVQDRVLGLGLGLEVWNWRVWRLSGTGALELEQQRKTVR